MHLREKRTRKRRPELVVHGATHRGDVERADMHACEPLAHRGAQELVQQDALESRAAREEQADPLRAEASGAVGESRGGREVEPLRVVDGDDDGFLLGEHPEGVHERDAQRAGLERRAFVVVEGEGTRERTSLESGQRLERVLQHGVEEIAHTGERQRRLALDGLGLEHEETGVFRVLDRGAPEGRLPHSRFSLEHECGRLVRDSRDEVPQGRQLGVPSCDDLDH